MPQCGRVIFAAILASIGSISAAAAGCVSCGCADLPTGCVASVDDIAPVLLSPLPPSFHVEQGPTYKAVIIAEDEVERRMMFDHPRYFPYIRLGRRHASPLGR